MSRRRPLIPELGELRTRADATGRTEGDPKPTPPLTLL
jgi:hypothetical protein